MQVLEEIHIEDNVEKEDSESKKMLQIEIQNRINAMNGLVFEISDSDLDDIQGVIETNSDDDADHDEASTFVKEADVSSQPPVHKSENAVIADPPVGSPDTALNTDFDQQSSVEDDMPNANSHPNVQNELNHEVESMLRQLKGHIPDKYIVTFDEVTKSIEIVAFFILLNSNDILLQKSNRFHISGINKYVKGAILKIVIDWNSQPVFDGVIHDAKFVELLLVGVIGKNQLIAESYSKKDLRFIQGWSKFYLSTFFSSDLILITLLTFIEIFVQRVNNQTSRAVRFGGYVQNKIKREQRKLKSEEDH